MNQSIICDENRRNVWINQSSVENTERTILYLALSFLHQGWIPCGGKLWTGATHYSTDTTDETIGVVVIIVIAMIIENILMIVIIVIIEVILMIISIVITWHSTRDNRSRCRDDVEGTSQGPLFLWTPPCCHRCCSQCPRWWRAGEPRFQIEISDGRSGTQGRGTCVIVKYSCFCVSCFKFLNLGVHHLPRGLRGGCRRGDDVDAPDHDIGDDIDDDIGDDDDIDDDDDDNDYVDQPLTLSAFLRTASTWKKKDVFVSLFLHQHLAIKLIVQFWNFDTLEFETANTISVVASKILHMCEISKLGNMHARDSEVEFQASSSNDTEFLRMSNTAATHHQLFLLSLSLISLRSFVRNAKATFQN